MNQEWSMLNRQMQAGLKTAGCFAEGLAALYALRGQLMEAWRALRLSLRREDFDAMPFPRAEGYHSKTIAYSLWHILRIEDIVAHDLIGGGEEIFFAGDYRRRIGAPIVTTGNELTGRGIVEFSRALNLDALFEYAEEVRSDTEALLSSLAFADLRRKDFGAKKEALRALGVVSADERAAWLIDYWCGKDVRGLIQMPFSRHWIMHTEAALRIRDRLIGGEVH